MQDNEKLLPYIQSPDNETAVLLKDNYGLISSVGDFCYPLVNGIPWLLTGAPGALLHWQGKTRLLISHLQEEIRRNKNKLNYKNLLDLSKERIQLSTVALSHNLGVMESTLQPLMLFDTSQVSLLEALIGRPPMGQELVSYENNLFRDWGWDDNHEGNRQAMDAIDSILNSEFSWGDTLTLGVGACRLPADLNVRFSIPFHIACDINPKLMLIGQKILSGESITYYERPGSPKNLACSSVKRTLKSDPKHSREGLYFIFADGTSNCFKPSSFDTVVTPWFIDIIGENLRNFVRHLNQFLKPGGTWINYGPLLFDHRDIEERYTYDEVKFVVQECGFDIIKEEQNEFSYLRSPASSHQRQETVYAFSAKKVCDVKPSRKSKASLPSWLINPELPVPKQLYMEKEKSGLMLKAQLLDLIDGKRSLEVLAVKAAHQHQIQPEQAYRLLLGYLTELYELDIVSKFRGV